MKRLILHFPILAGLAVPLTWGAVIPVGPGETHETISSAVAAAAGDDELEIAAGLYEENVVVDKPLVLRGANHGVSAGVAAGVRGPETEIKGGFHILPAAAGTVVSGFRIGQGLADEDALTGIIVEGAEVTIRDSVIEGVGVIPAEIPGSRGLSIGTDAHGAAVFDNLISGNGTGIRIGAAGNVSISGNRISANSGDGLGLDASGTINLTVSGNLVENHSVAGVRVADASGGVSLGKNAFLGNALAVVNQSVQAVDAKGNFWNTGEAPPAENGANGYSGAVVFSPWYAEQALQTLVVGEDLVIGQGESVEVETLHIAPDVTYTVDRGSLKVGSLELQEDAVLEVIDGELTLDVSGGNHTIAGTFRITHSLGSIEILADTTFSGSTLGLVSDFHIADGVTLSVTGSLLLDGCRLLGEGGFVVVVNIGAELEMVRCDVEGGLFYIVGSDVRLADNVFTGSQITVFGTVNGAKIYHNVFSGGPGNLSILPGAVVQTAKEGWGNVASIPDAKNRLILAWQASTLPGRTLDADGTLYVQPGDAAHVDLDSGGFTARVQAAELLLAYHSGYLALDGFNPKSPWENELYLSDQPLSLFGKVDAAAGFGFGFEDLDGTLTDHVIGDFEFTAGPDEGRTLVFFREKETGDHPLIDTRLTTSDGGTPGFLESPFTRNSGTLVIDGTQPLIEETTAEVTQDLGGGPIDVLQSGVFTRIGDVAIVFDAFDALAGVDPSSVSVVLDGPVQFTAIPGGTGDVILHGESYTRYGFGVEISGTTPDGLYDVIVTVTDRSGNTTVWMIGTLEVAKWIATVEVACQGLVATPLTRDVVFVATDAVGNVLGTRTEPVDFNGGTGTVTLAGLPDGTAHLSAKTAWTKRKRLPCGFDPAGDAVVSFTGADWLLGGDLNNDNVVNGGDYNILNANWFTTDHAADITGNGQVDGGDYNILNLNWFTVGDPQ